MRNRKSNSLLDVTANYIIKLLASELSHQYLYHGIHHTFEVVNYSKVIGQNSGLKDEYLEDLLLSAWFHDVGFVEAYKDHEQKSVFAAESFLSNLDVNKERLSRISNCILATKLETKPKNLLEQIICDADTAHVGLGIYIVKQELLRMELESLTNHSFGDLEWAIENYNFLTNHIFYTEYARKKYSAMKEQNIDEIIERIEIIKLEKGE